MKNCHFCNFFKAWNVSVEPIRRKMQGFRLKSDGYENSGKLTNLTDYPCGLKGLRCREKEWGQLPIVESCPRIVYGLRFT